MTIKGDNMINILPEPKHLIDTNGSTKLFKTFSIDTHDKQLLKIAETRFWNYPEIFEDTVIKSY